MQPFFKRSGIFFSVFLILASAGVSRTLAASSFNLTTSPLPVQLNASPGETVSTVLKIQNSGKQPVDLEVELQKFGADGITGKPTISQKNEGDYYFDWVSFSQNKITAKPGVWNNITMTIKVPSSGAFGYYYAVVFNQVTTDVEANGPTAKIRAAAAILVLLDVQTFGEKRQLEVASITLDKKIYEYLPTTFTVRVKNPGNTHVIPAGNIIISKNGKKDLALLHINSSAGNVLPKSTRVFETSWDDGFPVFVNKMVDGKLQTDSKGNPIKQLTWNFSKLNKIRIGRYKAHMLLSYNDGVKDIPIEKDISFWVIPWKILPIIIIISGLIALGIWSALKPIRKVVKKLFIRISKPE